MAYCLFGDYLNQRRNIINSNFRNRFQWNSMRDSYILIQENAFENDIYEMATIL